MLALASYSDKRGGNRDVGTLRIKQKAKTYDNSSLDNY